MVYSHVPQTLQLCMSGRGHLLMKYNIMSFDPSLLSVPFYLQSYIDLRSYNPVEYSQYDDQPQLSTAL